MQDLYDLVKDVEVVSFDIFDTLIVRLYDKPIDLFYHLEESLKINGFAQARISAELDIRAEYSKKGVHEVTLEEIYNNMHNTYKDLMTAEVHLEKIMCKKNPEVYAIYQQAVELGKKVIIASDMYLPVNLIEEILVNAGYTGYDKLFLSSDTRRPKATGEMYQDVLDYTGSFADEILHIGDNYLTDYKIAKEKGLSAFHYEPIKRKFGDNFNFSYYAMLNKYVSKSIAPSIVKGLINYDLTSNERSYWEEFGYKYIGILAYGYCTWLKKEFERENISSAYFMLRDGHIFKKVFDILYSSFETHEIYGSRRMFLFSGMRKWHDIKSRLINANLYGVSYAEFWKSLTLEDEILYQKYLEMFPVQTVIITDNNDLEKIELFFIDNIDKLYEISCEERKLQVEYLKSLNITNKKTAIVDLGWKGSMLKGLQGLSEIEKLNLNLIGYYLATHTFNSKGMNYKSFSLDNGNTRGIDSLEILLNDGFIVNILELVFSAPHPSVINITKSQNLLKPVYQDLTDKESERIEISEMISKGVTDFTRDFNEIMKKYEIKVNTEISLISLKYLYSDISRYDQFNIEKIHFLPGLGNNNTSYPICKRGIPLIGLISPWEGGRGISGEHELLERVKRTAINNHFHIVLLDNHGYILDENQKSTGTSINPKDLSFIITVHYLTPKLVDSFYYHTLWNPPEIPLNLANYTTSLTNNYIMNDDFLCYDDGGMKNHLKSMLINKPRTLAGHSSLTASLPSSVVLKPKLENPKMFYCGMNWEKLVHNSNRHEGLFKLLDNTNTIEFYGPEKVETWGNIAPWEGYKNYKYSIPFDGFSILNEINRCGVCLVLSSDIHRRAGAETNRLYEACASGAVIITDQNPFMKKYFSDAALFIHYDKNDPKDAFNQIMEKFNWIEKNKDKAIKLAKNAQKIFMDKFTLDKQFSNIIFNHAKRFETISNDLFAQDSKDKILVTYVCNSNDFNIIQNNLLNVIKNIKNQLYRNIELAIGIDHSLFEITNLWLKSVTTNTTLLPLKLYDRKGSKLLTDGCVIRALQKRVHHKYYININANETWFYDHLTTMVRTITDNNAFGAYSATSYIENTVINLAQYQSLSVDSIYTMKYPNFHPASGQFMFVNDDQKLVSDYLMELVDGYEHYLYTNLYIFKHKRKLSFTARMTLAYNNDYKNDVRNNILSEDMQIRFIQDLVKFDLPMLISKENISNTATNVINKIEVKRIANNLFKILPLKNYIKLRYYQRKLRGFKSGTPKYEKYKDKYDNEVSKFERFLNI